MGNNESKLIDALQSNDGMSVFGAYELLFQDTLTVDQFETMLAALIAAGKVNNKQDWLTVAMGKQSNNESKQVQSEIADCLQYVSDLPAYEIAKRIGLSESRVQLNLDAMLTRKELTANSAVLTNGETMVYYSLAKQEPAEPKVKRWAVCTNEVCHLFLNEQLAYNFAYASKQNCDILCGGMLVEVIIVR